MAQLDLFNTLVVRTELNEPQPKEPIPLIEVFTLCRVCGTNNHLTPHAQIHSDEYMSKNWENMGNNQWVVYGICSRQCEIKFNQQHGNSEIQSMAHQGQKVF